MHTPDISQTFKVAGFLRKGEKFNGVSYEIKHELIGFCGICKNFHGKSSFQHFLIDRVANEDFPDIWNSKIRVIYIGPGQSCDRNDANWLERRSNVKINVFNEGEARRLVTMNGIFGDIKKYLKDFPVYNALYNCQHFASNLFSKITGKKTEFVSKDVMIINNNEETLKYEFI